MTSEAAVVLAKAEGSVSADY